MPDGDLGAHLYGYVDRLKKAGAIRSAAVERAFLQVQRHLLVNGFYINSGNGYTKIDHDPTVPTERALELIYSERPLVTRLRNARPSSSTSNPVLVARMLELLELRMGHRVLEIGAGTGYNAALVAEIIRSQANVVTLDFQEDVVQETKSLLTRARYPDIGVHTRDGFKGAPEAAPYDRIVVTVGCPDLAPPWLRQLSDSGRILLPLRQGGANPLVRVWLQGKDVLGCIVGFSGFMGIEGKLEMAEYQRVPSQTEAPGVTEALWGGLERRREEQGLPWWRWKRAGFWLFITLNDVRARLIRWHDNFGLVDGSSFAVVGSEQISSSRDQTLMERLVTLYEEWKKLDSPRMADYTIVFFPSFVRLPDWAQERAWTVGSRYYCRVFYLD